MIDEATCVVVMGGEVGDVRWCTGGGDAIDDESIFLQQEGGGGGAVRV